MIVRRPGVYAHPDFCLGRAELGDLLRAVAEVVGIEEGFDLHLVDDAEMARLNAAHMGVGGPTNVLSFPAGEGPGGEAGGLGDVVLCVDTLEREARLYGQHPREHAARLIAHAALHLAGHEHGALMEELTEAAVETAVAAARDVQ